LWSLSDFSPPSFLPFPFLSRRRYLCRYQIRHAAADKGTACACILSRSQDNPLCDRAPTMTSQTAKASAMEKKNNAVNAFKSWDNFKQWVLVPDTALDRHSNGETGKTWSNVDLDPTPPEKRTWRCK
jgi:phage terminase large subunit GpA-like protein